MEHERVLKNGGTVESQPQLDNGERWLAEINDPAGNRIGIVAAVRGCSRKPCSPFATSRRPAAGTGNCSVCKATTGRPHYERLPPHRNPPSGEGNGPSHREIWIGDPDGYYVVVASPDGEAQEP